MPETLNHHTHAAVHHNGATFFKVLSILIIAWCSKNFSITALSVQELLHWEANKLRSLQYYQLTHLGN